MSGGLEIERKFLVGSMPDREPLRVLPMRQGYLSTGETEVRLRSDGSRHTLTCKRGSGMTRFEGEIGITREQFDALWPMTEGCRIAKTRRHFDHEGHLLEIDSYHDALAPLVVAEVEFATEDDARDFVPPAFFGREVTDDSRYKNRRLATDGLPPG